MGASHQAQHHRERHSWSGRINNGDVVVVGPVGGPSGAPETRQDKEGGGGRTQVYGLCEKLPLPHLLQLHKDIREVLHGRDASLPTAIRGDAGFETRLPLLFAALQGVSKPSERA